MEILATMKVNDLETGELLQAVRAVFTCEECADLDEFCDNHGEAVEEYLENFIHPDNLSGDTVNRVDLIVLADSPAEVEL